jgi:dihydrolipoamide dehydrogenase
MTTNTDYDVLVVGAGPAGENVADVATQGGLKVAIVERQLVGGECSYWGCMPSKALLRPGEAMRMMKRVPGARAALTGDLDVEKALKRRNSLAANWDDSGQVNWLESANVDLIRGHGRLAGERTVEVTTDDGTVTRFAAAKAVVVAVGTGALIPPIEGLRETRTWDNRDITEAKEVPRRLLVLGGGVIGVEMAQAWNDLGSEEVTIVEMAPRLLPREEPFVGAELKEALESYGITVHVESKMVKVERDASDAPVRGHLENGIIVEADEILVAIGRRPLTADLGLETVGLEPGKFIQVDDHLLATGIDGGWLYVVGDVNGRALLTHAGKYQARIAGNHIAGHDTKAWGDVAAVPRVIFTDPAIAAVGLTEAEAADRGMNVHTVQYDVGWTAGAAALGQGIKGTSQLVIDGDRQTIVGATFVGPGVGELLHAATIAIVGEVDLNTLWHAIPSFPTISEIWLRFSEAYRDKYGVHFT